jgi:5-methylcytosine-specific restriction endonuclease McrA
MEALSEFATWANAADAAGGSATASDGNAGPRTGRDPSLRLRFRVLLRDRFTCCACGASPALSHGVELQVDHIVAWSSGGETIESNLRTLCARCNLGKSNVL